MSKSLLFSLLVLVFLFGGVSFVSASVSIPYGYMDYYSAPACVGYEQVPASGQSCCSGYVSCSYGGCG
ncbi:hypothetical protein J4470_02985, partial [Candidatus Woesearchaeota archaeon]|nr:hypothetical protein [Candidatus Woesearchaeota archaeon]